MTVSPRLPDRARLRAGFLAGRMSAQKDIRVSAPASAALYILGDRSGVHKLLAALRSPQWPARYSASLAAVTARIPDLAVDLASLLGDESLQIRSVALQALINLRGEPGTLGFNPGAPLKERAKAQSLWTKWARSLTIRHPSQQVHKEETAE
jgi:hypothetical protein